jgi:hypothetical protein
MLQLLQDGELLTKTFYVYHPIKYKHTPITITHIYLPLNYGSLWS